MKKIEALKLAGSVAVVAVVVLIFVVFAAMLFGLWWIAEILGSSLESMIKGFPS